MGTITREMGSYLRPLVIKNLGTEFLDLRRKNVMRDIEVLKKLGKLDIKGAVSDVTNPDNKLPSKVSRLVVSVGGGTLVGGLIAACATPDTTPNVVLPQNPENMPGVNVKSEFTVPNIDAVIAEGGFGRVVTAAEEAIGKDILLDPSSVIQITDSDGDKVAVGTVSVGGDKVNLVCASNNTDSQGGCGFVDPRTPLLSEAYVGDLPWQVGNLSGTSYMRFEMPGLDWDAGIEKFVLQNEKGSSALGLEMASVEVNGQDTIVAGAIQQIDAKVQGQVVSVDVRQTSITDKIVEWLGKFVKFGAPQVSAAEVGNPAPTVVAPPQPTEALIQVVDQMPQGLTESQTQLWETAPSKPGFSKEFGNGVFGDYLFYRNATTGSIERVWWPEAGENGADVSVMLFGDRYMLLTENPNYNFTINPDNKTDDEVDRQNITNAFKFFEFYLCAKSKGLDMPKAGKDRVELWMTENNPLDTNCDIRFNSVLSYTDGYPNLGPQSIEFSINKAVIFVMTNTRRDNTWAEQLNGDSYPGGYSYGVGIEDGSQANIIHIYTEGGTNAPGMRVAGLKIRDSLSALIVRSQKNNAILSDSTPLSTYLDEVFIPRNQSQNSSMHFGSPILLK